MRVLVLTQYYWPESFRINEVVESLRHLGCQITVLTGQPNYPQGEVFDGYSTFGCGVEEHEAGYSIYRVPLVARGRGGAWGLLANYLSFVFSATLIGPWLLRKQRFDVVFVYAPSPILQTIPAIWIAFIKRAKLVTWVQDLWPQSLEVTGFVRNRHLLDMVAVVVRWIYRRCDLLLVQSQAFISGVQAMAGKTPVQYHPNPGELAFSQAQPVESSALILDPGFNVVFAGNLGTVQALGTLLDAAELLQTHTDVRIVLVGSGSRSEWVQQEIIRRQLSNVRLPGRYTPQSMPGILGQASALLVSLARNPAMSQTIPSKVQAYLAAGKPIIASLDGEGARVVEESGAGVSCPAEDAAALALAVIRLKTASSEELQRMGKAGITYYKRHFDPAVLATKLIEYFSRAMQNANNDNG
jgi:glycosyltransferase involved in cell wall biosynthesis